MAEWVLKATRQVVPRQSLRPLTTVEKHSTVENKKRDVFDALIERRMETSINPPPTTEDRDPTSEELTNQNDLDDEMDEPVESPDHEDILDSMGRILEQQPVFDKIINAEVMIQNGMRWQWEKWQDNLLMLMGGQQRPTMTIPSSTLSHMMWSFPMDKSRNMAPTSLVRTCSPRLTQMDIAYH